MKIREHNIPVAKEAEEAMRGSFVDFEWPASDKFYSVIQAISCYPPPNMWIMGGELTKVVIGDALYDDSELGVYFTGEYARDNLIYVTSRLRVVRSVWTNIRASLQANRIVHKDEQHGKMNIYLSCDPDSSMVDMLKMQGLPRLMMAWNVKHKRLYIDASYDKNHIYKSVY